MRPIRTITPSALLAFAFAFAGCGTTHARQPAGDASGPKPADAAAAEPAAASPTADASATVCGKVTLDPKLAPKFEKGATLFVFAKHQPGGGPPVAVLRQTVDAFPVGFCLSQKNTMVPGMKFEGKVYVTARVDADGSAGAGPGDLEGKTAEPIPVGKQDLVIHIDTAR